jgi:hypothetical protein
MTEEKLSPALQKPPKRWRIRLVGAVLLLFVALLVLFRTSLAEGIAGVVCGQQKLTCSLKITRLDLGGITVRGIDVRAPKAPDAALSASNLVVDFNWTSPFSLRARSVGGDDVVVRVDFSGTRPLLGDLDQAVKTFTKGGGEPGPMPQLDFKTLKVIGDTPLGPVEAHGKIAATGPDAFVIQLNAPPARLGLLGAELQLNGADLNATVAGKEIKGHANVDLAAFEFRDSVISNLKFDVTLDQTAGVLRGAGTASMGKVTLDDTNLSGAEAKASIESAAVDPAAFDLSAWLANVRKLSLNATAGEGVVGKTGWSKGVLTVEVGPRQTGGSGGDISFSAQNIRTAQGAAGQVELVGEVDIPKQGEARAQGMAKLRGGALTSAARKELAAVLADPFEAALPAFGAAARRAVERAGASFDITLPWAAEATNDGIDIAALTGSALKAASGLSVTLDALPGSQSVVSWNTEDGGRWTAAGAMRMSGGGGPQMSVDLARATGAQQVVSMAGAASLKSWRVGGDVLSAEATGLEFDTNDDGGGAAGQFTVRLDGLLAGGVWKAARATGQIKSAWTPNSFYADAPRGLVIQWDEGRYGDTRLGAGALHYTPTGRLAELSEGAISGKGVLAPIKLPIRGGGYTANTSLGQTAVNWRAEGGLRAGFDAAPSTVDFKFGERSVPMRIQDIAGVLDVREGWRVTGNLRGGEAKADEATVADIAAKFDLGGAGGAINGSLSNLAMRVFDPLSEDNRRYEEVKFEGAANLKNSVANFSGAFTSAKKGVQVASITGAHSLETGAGSLEFAPTPLIFAPRSFQPYDLSPLLRGPANVIGRVDIAGGADWSSDHFKTRASVDLRKIGFALATTGVFEGVSGKVVVSDLMQMASDPGQTITIDKVTLGLPIENGTIKFRLIGFDAIRLESAEWPFVGGFIRVKPADFKFDEPSNRIVAQAVDWDLNKIIELFKVPDVKVDGIVNGDIPVVFSTGSAEIDNAQLMASEKGGVIQYTGSTGDAAAQTDQNAKMLFDALKDFRYRVLEVGLDGDITGQLKLSLNLSGRNPTVMAGAEFKLGISIDSELMKLLNTTQGWRGQLSGAVVKPD